MKIRIALAGLLVAGMVSGCRSAPERRYSLQAEVISVDAARGLIVVKHGEIPGLMPAMTMQYAVADAKQIETLQPGNKISAELVVSESKGRLEKIVLASKADVKPKAE